MKLLYTTILFVFVIFVSAAAVRAQESSIKSSSQISVGETLRIHSNRLGEEREIRVYLPATYFTSDSRYPVIYTLDGETTGPVVASAVQFMNAGSELPQMPEVLVVAIHNTNRNRDMPIPQEYGKGGEGNFLAFMSNELVPLIEQKYRTEPLRLIIGHSQGGTFVHYALTAQPGLFQWYLALDAPLFGPVHPLLEKARTTITRGSKNHLRLVTVEGTFGWGKDWPSLIAAAPNEFFGDQVEIKDETHETMVFKGIYEGLKRLFHDYAPDVKDGKLEYLESKYLMLSESYGYRVNIPPQVLLRSASRNIMVWNGVEAIKLVQRAIDLYGPSTATKRLLAEAQDAATKQGPDKRVEEFLNSPSVDVGKMKSFMGTWAGKMEMPDGETLGLVLKFQADGDTTHAYLTVTPPGSSPYQMMSDFIRDPKGDILQWGFRNRGGGIILQTARLVDENTLKGSEEPVGVPMPPGMKSPPNAPFVLTRLPVPKN